MKSCQKYFSVCLLALFASAAFGQAPDMGDALDFAVLGGTNVTCTAGVVDRRHWRLPRGRSSVHKYRLHDYGRDAPCDQRGRSSRAG